MNIHLVQNLVVEPVTASFASLSLLFNLKIGVHNLDRQLRRQIKRRRPVLGPSMVGSRRVRQNVLPNRIKQRPLSLPTPVNLLLRQVSPINQSAALILIPQRPQEERTANRGQFPTPVRQIKLVRKRPLQIGRFLPQRVSLHPPPLHLPLDRMCLHVRPLLAVLHGPIRRINHLPLLVGNLRRTAKVTVSALFLDDTAFLDALLAGLFTFYNLPGRPVTAGFVLATAPFDRGNSWVGRIGVREDRWNSGGTAGLRFAMIFVWNLSC
uniref:(northern house mosquito) hypothetical protein n=1 Tax=Culex pipiens TaxID=7175 RepID=A0A8D8MRT6_CULPI